jgi:hypothetical protein
MKIKKSSHHHIITLLLLFTLTSVLKPQTSVSQGISINTTGNTADNSAILDISSTSQGLLIPRMTTLQRNNIASPATSLLIFNTTTNCFEAYVNSIWYSVSCPPVCNTFTCPGSGYITTIAGNGGHGYNGDGIPATDAELSAPNAVTADYQGNVYISDMANNRIRKVEACTGIISTIAGGGSDSSDGIPATNTSFGMSQGIAVDGAGNVFFADRDNSKVRKITHSTGLISTIAGTGVAGYNGDGIAGSNAELNYPRKIALDASGNVYIGDELNSRIRKVTVSTGIISTVAGNGTRGYNGDGIPATDAELGLPAGVAVDVTGNVYIADWYTNSIRKVTVSTGIISTIAGNHSPIYPTNGGYNGDGIPATDAYLSIPVGVSADSEGNVFIADQNNYRVRKVTVSSGLISTISGTGILGYNNDGIPGTSAELGMVTGVFADGAGNIYIADYNNQRIRKVCY